MVGSLSPVTIWKEREEWLESQKASVEAWTKMDSDQREAVIQFVGHDLQELLETIEEWVPYSLIVEEGKFMDVRFRLIMASLEAHIEEMKKITAMQVREAAAGTAAILGELENGPATVR